MKTTEYRCNKTKYIRTWTPCLSVVLLGVLSACGEGGVNSDIAAGQVDGTETSAELENAITPGIATTSLSATELSDNSTIIAQTALALEESNNNAVELAAANPETENSESVVELGAANPEPEDSESDVVPSAANSETEDSESVAEPAAANPETEDSESVAEPAAANPETEDSESESASVDNNAAPIDEETAEESGTANEAERSAGEPERFFTSVTTSGFEAEVLDDAIHVTWEADPQAIGYNVYKQGDFHSSVVNGATELIDPDVYDDDYYYEIEAWDVDRNLYRVATGLTVRPRSFGRTDPDAPTPNENLLDDYEMVFSDEFNNIELDASKWNTRFLWGPYRTINNEEQFYVDVVNDPNFGYNPFTFDGEHLTINTIETPPELLARANNKPYLSGIITSYDAFKFTYGYAETRAKFTHGRGYWPAFWLLNAYYGDADPEIDIMEFIGHNQDTMYHTYHYFDASGELRSTDSIPVTGIDFTEDFHTFGVEWSPGLLVFYVDGIETYRLADINVSNQEMYVLANQAVGGWWAGSPDDSTPFPGEYIIDYIRVYQQITPQDDIRFDQPTDVIPIHNDRQNTVIPNKRPPASVWPEGYPTR